MHGYWLDRILVQATYYGLQSPEGAGACSYQFSSPIAYTMPWTAGVALGVAMNMPQYNGSYACGMCMQYRGTGAGSGLNPVSTDYQYAIGARAHLQHMAVESQSRLLTRWHQLTC